MNINLVGLAFLDAAEEIDCYWTFETDDDTRIILFTAENLLQLQDFITVIEIDVKLFKTWLKFFSFIPLKVYDGSNVQEPQLTLMNQQHSEKSHKDLPPSLYTTGPTAVVRIDHAKLLAASKTLSINSLQLRVAKVFN